MGYGNLSKCGGTSWILFHDVPPGLAGETNYCSDGYGITELHVYLNPDTSLYSLADGAAHEIGHGLGLGHSPDPSAVMYGTVHPASGLGQDDIAGIRTLYPMPPPFSGGFYLRNSNTTGKGEIGAQLGNTYDRPIVGDWNRDGVDTIGVYRPSNQTFYLRNSNTTGKGEIVAQMGNPGDGPIVGDWNGDGIDTIGVYRPSNQTFYLRNSNTTGTGEIVAQMGNPGDGPIVGDWNGDGIDTIGVTR